ncbi:MULTISPECIES: ABC transporter ATP-binding protein [unclassified Marinobacter]|uniref:Lauroyl acyltransferase n=1 Tax=Marinobacter nauticus TaxID=2743 RepID=A0A455WJ07_MARNT|nr:MULTISPECIES: ABC transporter ATP-binding protein [unclassified Marinobacter]QFS88467.1 Aliphatic sulfonates import ATP-binding protein SsuB [Marinobacter sp. THAF197a]QFT52252.1 Aliphatic sulfonates import ATP-binding protein SsuB [Marinobacter sp. THAF39]BBJ05558.1 lauroyl acyltransferase [Marinobacter nauticus]
MSFITVNNLWKEYGDQVVLENLNLSVKQGEFCTLVGASGCGKSTFLKMLLGQETQTRGELLLDGAAFPAEPDRNRGIVFQRYSVFPHLTVRQNVLMGLELEQKPLLGKLFGRARKDALARVDAMLESVGLSPSANKWPHELSGGMQQRLAIAQSLIMRPRVLLLDEPFGALDPGIRSDMHNLLLKLWRETGTTIFMVTHDLKEGFYLGTRLLVFDKTRHDPHSPNAYGATITYDLPIGKTDRAVLEDIDHSVAKTARYQAA